MDEHRNVPHCDTVTATPEEKRFWADVYANDEYQKLVDARERARVLLKDVERWFGRAVFKMHEEISWSPRMMMFINSMKEHQKNIDEISLDIKRVLDEIQTLQGSAKNDK